MLSISCSIVLYSRSVVFSCFHLPAPAICHLATAQKKKKKNGSSEPRSSLPFFFHFSKFPFAASVQSWISNRREKTHIYRCVFSQRSPVKPTRVILCVLFLMGAGFPPRVKSREVPPLSLQFPLIHVVVVKEGITHTYASKKEQFQATVCR